MTPQDRAVDLVKRQAVAIRGQDRLAELVMRAEVLDVAARLEAEAKPRIVVWQDGWGEVESALGPTFARPLLLLVRRADGRHVTKRETELMELTGWNRAEVD